MKGLFNMKRMKSYAQAQIINCFREVYSMVHKRPITDDLKNEVRKVVLKKLSQLLREDEIIQPENHSIEEVIITQSNVEALEGKITIRFPMWLKEQFEDEEA